MLNHSQKLLVTVDEAADLLCVGRTTVYELIAAGQLKSVKIGAARRVPLDALTEFVAILETRNRNS